MKGSCECEPNSHRYITVDSSARGTSLNAIFVPLCQLCHKPSGPCTSLRNTHEATRSGERTPRRCSYAYRSHHIGEPRPAEKAHQIVLWPLSLNFRGGVFGCRFQLLSNLPPTLNSRYLSIISELASSCVCTCLPMSETTQMSSVHVALVRSGADNGTAAQNTFSPLKMSGPGTNHVDETALALLARASRLMAPSPKPGRLSLHVGDACNLVSPVPKTPKTASDMREVRSLWKEERLRGDSLNL